MLSSPKPLRILCVTYTNHALDDFLEGLIKVGITNVVRLGSRSRNPNIADYTIKAIAQRSSAPPSNQAMFNRRFAALKGAMGYKAMTLHSVQNRIMSDSKPLRQQWASIEPYLDRIGSAFLDELRQPKSLDGFTIVGSDGKEIRPDKLWTRWLRGKEHPNGARPQDSCWSLNKQERLELAQRWVSEVLEAEVDSLANALRSYDYLREDFADLRASSDYQIVNTAEVILCTTTGAAKSADLLSQAQCDVVLVEEAGEILEPHVLSAIYERAKALILIGDHLQLRPKVPLPYSRIALGVAMRLRSWLRGITPFLML